VTAWDTYVGAVMRIEAPGGVVWVRPAPLAHTAGPYPDPDGRTLYVLTAHNPGGQVVPAAENAAAEARLAAELERRDLTWWPAGSGAGVAVGASEVAPALPVFGQGQDL
jgi:uncharacterized protein DUF3293